MAKSATPVPIQLIEKLHDDIDAIIQDHALDQKSTSREERLRGLQLIGRRVNDLGEGTSLTGVLPLLNATGKLLNGSYRKGFSGGKLSEFARLEQAFPVGVPIRPELSSGQIHALTKVKDPTRRMALMDIAADEGWAEYRIALHAQGLETALASRGCHHIPIACDDDALLHIRAYVAAYGIVGVRVAQELYCGSSGLSRETFAFENAVLFLDGNFGKAGEPYVWRCDEAMYLVAPELFPENAGIRYHVEDYQYSYQPYERMNEFAEDARRAREKIVEARRDAILRRHRDIPAKRIDFDSELRGDSITERLSYQLKHVIARLFDESDRRLGAYDGEFDYALGKLLRYVGMTGVPSNDAIACDVKFILCCVGLGAMTRSAHPSATSLLGLIYQHAPIWELNGHSTAEWAHRVPPSARSPRDPCESPGATHDRTNDSATSR